MKSGFEALTVAGIAVQRDLLTAGDVARARVHGAGPVVSASRAFGKSIEQYEAYAKERETQLWENAAAKRRHAYIGTGAVLAVCLLLLVLGDLYVVHFVKRPLDDLRGHFQRIAAGDLTAPIAAFGRNCVGQVIPICRTCRPAWSAPCTRCARAYMKSIPDPAKSPRATRTCPAAPSSRPPRWRKPLPAWSSCSTVSSNAENARQANQMASTASEVAQRGGQAVRDAVNTMREIAQDSSRIEDIVGVIDGIAFQTNILALNAAVEAARAGEQGKGFAVVAGEVRSLAQRSATAAKEIKQLLNTSGATVQAGSTQVETAGRTMEEIVRTIEHLTSLVADIAAASQEQVTGIDQVNTAVTQMDHVTQQNAALVEEAAAAASSLETQAQRLQSAVSAFRLPSQAGLPALAMAA